MTSQEDSLRDIQEEIFHEVFKAFIEEKRRKNPKLCPYCNAKLLSIECLVKNKRIFEDKKRFQWNTNIRKPLSEECT